MTEQASSHRQVTIEQIESKIVGEAYFAGDKFQGITVGDLDLERLKLLTICIIQMQNGFMATGESACADPRIYNEQKGRDLARQAAISKIWRLEGYLLCEDMYQDARSMTGQ